MEEKDGKLCADTVFDAEEQRARQISEWEKLALTIKYITPKTIVGFAVGIAAAALCAIFFVFTDETRDYLAVCAVMAAVVAAIALANSVTNIVLARLKRKKMLPRLIEYMDEKFAGIPSPAPLSLSFSDEAVAVSIGDKKETVPLSDCSAVEFEGMLAIDFGHFCGLCFTFGELGEAADDIRAILRAKGERYQFLERDGKSWQLYNDELRFGANGVPSSRA